MLFLSNEDTTKKGKVKKNTFLKNGTLTEEEHLKKCTCKLLY